MGGGILPIAKHNGEIYLLFSRERIIHSKDRDRGKWSDFGGAKDKNESQLRTAIRECFEESSGILGNKRDIENLTNNHLVGKIKTKTYSIWIVEVEYYPEIVHVFESHFKNGLKHDLSSVKAQNGLYEKDKLKWIKLSQLNKKSHLFRPWYKKFLPKIVKAIV